MLKEYRLEYSKMLVTGPDLDNDLEIEVDDDVAIYLTKKDVEHMLTMFKEES